jgi:hypothetical protein
LVIPKAAWASLLEGLAFKRVRCKQGLKNVYNQLVALFKKWPLQRLHIVRISLVGKNIKTNLFAEKPPMTINSLLRLWLIVSLNYKSQV